jgi:tetratricopeptide (TPR) repeat protein
LTSGGTTGQLQTSNEAKGKPCYRPPELLRSPSGYNNKTDIWGLGCILFELCVCEKAFQSDWDTYAYDASNPSGHPRIHFPNELGLTDGSKRAFRAWINKMLQVDYQDRPSAITLGQTFEELLSLLNPSSPEGIVNRIGSDPSQFCNPEYLLGTDLPAFEPPFRWEKVLPGSNVEQNLHFLQRWQTLVSERELLLGEEHPNTVWSIVCLAWTCFYVGPANDARVLFTKAMKRQIKLNGLEHEETLSVLKGQAWATGNLGRHKQASQLFKKFLKLSRRVLGQEHPETFSGMTGLARANLYQRKPGLAIKLLNIALLGQQKSEHRGPNHPETVECMSLLAAAYYQHGEVEKASDIYKEASELQSEILGIDNPDTLLNLSGLAWTHIRLGRSQDAVDILERRGVLAKQTRILGLDHPETRASIEGLAQAYQNLGDDEKAKILREKIIISERDK